MENKVKTSAGQETASETVARINAARAAAKDTPAPTSPKANAVMDALTERLTNQSKGISTSSSSELQSYINEAISGVKQSGEATFQRLESERGREMGYAQDRASTQFTSALESRSGYATQVVALRELTETTEKSLRDLDKRYQEAIMANDANTASTIAGLQMKKLEFLQQQEENHFKNLISVAGMQQNQNQFEREQDRLYQNSLTEAKQFEERMKQTDDQFTKNLGIQYKNLSLKEQELDISRERNQLSREEFALRKSELQKEKSKTALTATVFSDMRNQVLKLGQKTEDLDPTAYALWAAENYTDPTSANYNPQYASVSFDDIVIAAQMAKIDMVNNNIIPPTEPTPDRIGGIFGKGGLTEPIGEAASSFGSGFLDVVFGVKENQTKQFQGNSLQALTGQRPY